MTTATQRIGSDPSNTNITKDDIGSKETMVEKKTDSIWNECRQYIDQQRQERKYPLGDPKYIISLLLFTNVVFQMGVWTGKNQSNKYHEPNPSNANLSSGFYVASMTIMMIWYFSACCTARRN